MPVVSEFEENNPAFAKLAEMEGPHISAVSLSELFENEGLAEEMRNSPDDTILLLLSDGEGEEIINNPIAQKVFAIQIAGEKLAMLKVFEGAEVPDGYQLLEHLTPEKYNTWGGNGLFIDALTSWLDGVPLEVQNRLNGIIKRCFDAHSVEHI